jgi:hypothetical protein
MVERSIRPGIRRRYCSGRGLYAFGEWCGIGFYGAIRLAVALSASLILLKTRYLFRRI